MKALKFIFFIFLCFTLLVFDKLNPEKTHIIRKNIIDALTPVITAISKPFSYLYYTSYKWSTLNQAKHIIDKVTYENELLKQKILLLQTIKKENQELSKLLNFHHNTSFQFVTGHVIADNYSPYVRSLIVEVNNPNIKNGQAVISAEGLIGYVIESGKNFCRVLLLTDMTARIPIQIEDHDYHAILAGNNTSRPELLYIPNDITVFPGMRVISSGESPLIPAGIPIGHVAAITDETIYVQPSIKMEKIKYVSIITHDKQEHTDAP